MTETNVFATLSAIDITDKLKEKNKMSYLPWSSAWAIVKEHFPDATYEIVKTGTGCLYHTDGKTCWVETSLTISGETQNETLAVMDFKNASIPADTVQSTQFSKSIKRCLVKNAALFGLGLSLWNGEELSDTAKATRAKKKAEEDAAAEERKKAATELAEENAKIITLAQKKIAAGADNTALYEIVKKYADGKKNPNSIKSIEDSKKCYEEIDKMEVVNA